MELNPRAIYFDFFFNFLLINVPTDAHTTAEDKRNNKPRMPNNTNERLVATTEKYKPAANKLMATIINKPNPKETNNFLGTYSVILLINCGAIHNVAK